MQYLLNKVKTGRHRLLMFNSSEIKYEVVTSPHEYNVNLSLFIWIPALPPPNSLDLVEALFTFFSATFCLAVACFNNFSKSIFSFEWIPAGA